MHSRSACSAALANCAPAYCASARKVLGRGSHTATRPANISFRSQCTRIARCSVAAGDAALTPGSSDDARSSSAEEHGNSASANPHVQQAVSSARARQDQQSEQAPKQRSILKNFLIAIGNAVGQCLRALSNLQSASADQLRSNRVGRFLLWLIGKLFASDYNQSKVTGEDTAVNQAYLEYADTTGTRKVAAHAAWLKQLVVNRPEDVIADMEAQTSNPDISTDSAVVAQYMRALVATDRLDEYVDSTVSADGGQRMALLLSSLQRLSVGDAPGTKMGDSRQRPLHVIIQEPERPPFLVSLIRSVIGTMSWLLGFYLLFSLGANVLRRSNANTPNGNGGLAGIAQSGASGSGAYSPKEYKKEDVPEKSQKTFADVMGCPEAKAELEEVVEFLKCPGKFTKLGGKLPKGLLLTGPPGTGKTLLARAIAGEAGVPFFYRAGSEFEEMFVGVGSRRVRTLFAAAKKKAPCIVFIDEIDAIGGNRQSWESGGGTKKTLNQLLVEMDGFEVNEGVIVIGATNIPESLDSALTRPGRFDRHVAVPLPDVRGRADILRMYLKGKPVTDDVDVLRLARATPGFSGAQLSNLVNEAALAAAKSNQSVITIAGLEQAQDKILMGSERRSMVMTAQCRRNTAYHEAGHALVALKTPGALPIRKATIMPRGHALGMVNFLPEADKYDSTKQECYASIDVAMGGKAAEELIFGNDNTTTGVTSDLRSASRTARHMIAECGMSEKLGPIYAEAGSEKSSVASSTATLIDAEVSAFVREGYQRALKILRDNEKQLHMLAGALIDHETLTSTEINQVLDGSFSRPLPSSAAILEADGKVDAIPLPSPVDVPAPAGA